MHNRLAQSIIAHTVLILILTVGIPAIFERKDYEPIAMTVEIVPIKDISNLPKFQKPLRKDPAPAQQPPKPKPVQQTAAAKPEPAKPAPSPIPSPDAKEKPEDVKKPEPKTEDKPKPKEEDSDDFAVLMNKLKEEDSTEEPKEKPKEKKPDGATSKSDNYDPTVPLSISETDAIRSQFVKCWRMPAGAKDDYTLAVRVRVLVNQDGSVREVGLVPDQVSRYQSDGFFRAAADSAIRAVHACSPLQNLPMDKYSTWKDMELNFDPQEMLY